MTLYKADDTEISETGIEALITEETETDPWVVVNEHIYKGNVPDGTTFPEAQRMLLWPTGARVRRSAITAEFPNATISTVTPSSVPAAGGTVVTVLGTGFTPNSTVTAAGNAGTQVKVINSGKLTFHAPAHAAGTGNVVVTTDSGAVTKTNGITYV